jgi:hypothetical protein
MDLIFVVSRYSRSHILSVLSPFLGCIFAILVFHDAIAIYRRDSRARFEFGPYYLYLHSFAFSARFCLLDRASSFHCYVANPPCSH